MIYVLAYLAVNVAGVMLFLVAMALLISAASS